MFSLVIAVLAAIPPLIRQNLSQFVLNLVMLFARILICWFIHHFFLLHDFRRGLHKPPAAGIFASCALATVIIFFRFSSDVFVWGSIKRPCHKW